MSCHLYVGLCIYIYLQVWTLPQLRKRIIPRSLHITFRKEKEKKATFMTYLQSNFWHPWFNIPCPGGGGLGKPSVDMGDAGFEDCVYHSLVKKGGGLAWFLINFIDFLVKKEKKKNKTGNKSVLVGPTSPNSYNYCSYTVFKGLLKTPKHNTKKDEPVSMYTCVVSRSSLHSE